MSTINTFQEYSQPENTITNNVLLMLSMLYEISPRYYEDYINALMETDDFYKVVPHFRQQVNSYGKGFIDGHITIVSSTIIIETKISGKEWIEKLLKYSQSFNNANTKILFHLSKSRHTKVEINEIDLRLQNNEYAKDAKFYSLTYESLSEQLKQLNAKYPYDPLLFKLSENFDDYCKSMNLYDGTRNLLRAMACGLSYDLNIKHKFYFDLATRGYTPFTYLGIYKNKLVNYIAGIENMILANYNEESGLEVLNSSYDVTNEQKLRLTAAIKDSIEKGWEVGINHRFFLLKDFTKTEFRKISPGGIFRVKYFYLENYCSKDELKDIKTIATVLSNKEWQ